MEESKKHRIFIGNLPVEVKSTHLISVLPPGYDKSQVEIKHKYDIDKNVTSSYAFVNIEGTYNEVKAWCDKASSKSLGGNVIIVQFAKLSFLERLQQEVNSQRADKNKIAEVNVAQISHPHVQTNANLSAQKISRFKNYSSESSEGDEAISTEKVSSKDDLKKIKHNSQAEVRRIESLQGKSSTHLNQQKIIKMAINKTSKDSSNKIVFHDSDDEALDDGANEGNKHKLFGDSDDEKEVFFDETMPKTKLIRTKISSTDERFRMDSKFFEEDSNVRNDEASIGEQGKLLQMVDMMIDEKNPLGKLKSKRKQDLKAGTAILTRYDPLQKNHNSLIIKNDDDLEMPSKKPIRPKVFKVTQERFYEFSEDLKEQFKNNESTTAFSFLSMFGNSDDVSSKEATSTPHENDQDFLARDGGKSVDIKKLKNPLVAGISNFFNVDDDGVESEGDDIVDAESSKRPWSWHEPLFLNLTDPRIKEALEFFNSPPQDVLPYNVIRSHLKKIVKRKHRLNVAKAKEFKTKLGNRRKFQKGKDKNVDSRLTQK